VGWERRQQMQDGLFNAVHRIKSLAVEVFPRQPEAMVRFSIAFVAGIRHHPVDGHLYEYETRAKERQRGILVFPG